MVDIKSVLSVVFVLDLSLRDWEEKVSAGLKSFFEKDGHNVEPRRSPAVASSQQPQLKGYVLVPSTGNCGLQDYFNGLCDHDFQTFSATATVDNERERVRLKFMQCPRNEINWEDKRPFEAMHNACGEACSMAVGWEAIVYDNQYVKAGEVLDGKRALSINARRPVWNAKKPKSRLLITDDGEVVVE